ncbi:MAG: hypothetical protein WCW16_02875 [Candidatus Magasanikbacteria bacterium]
MSRQRDILLSEFKPVRDLDEKNRDFDFSRAGARVRREIELGKDLEMIEKRLDSIILHPEVLVTSMKKKLEEVQKIIDLQKTLKLRDSEKIDRILQPLSDITVSLSDYLQSLQGSVEQYTGTHALDMRQLYRIIQELFNQINTSDFQRSLFRDKFGHEDAGSSQEAMFVEYLRIIGCRLSEMKNFVDRAKDEE